MYQSPDMNLWKGRVNPDPKDQLLHQLMQPLDLTADLFTSMADHNFAILGFCSDEGVRRNMGRPGAKTAPDHIRRMSSGLSVHFDSVDQTVFDAGNVLCSGQNLEAAQKLLGEKVASLRAQDIVPIVLGGGHETAYGHFLGLRKAVPASETIGIVNLDAHFDVRSYEQGPHSGSPFRQIAEMEGAKFRYLPIGIRPESNVRSLFSFMQEHNQQYVPLEQLHTDFVTTNKTILSFVDEVDHIYLTIDMDCFPAAYAPGVSASAPSGMMPWHAISLIQRIKGSGKMLSVDIVEMNPEFDIDDRTLKLAAELIYHVLHD
jgi:formiminoglutamase